MHKHYSPMTKYKEATLDFIIYAAGQVFPVRTVYIRYHLRHIQY